MRIAQRNLIGRDVSPVTDGLVLWIDGRDSFIGTTAQPGGAGRFSAGSLKNRIGGTLCPFNISGSSGMYMVSLGDGFLTLASSYANRIMLCSCPQLTGVKTVEINVLLQNINDGTVFGSLVEKYGSAFGSPAGQNDGASTASFPVANVNDGVGKSIVGTVTPSGTEIYVNGVKGASGSIAVQPVNVTEIFTVKNAVNSGTVCKIASIRIYDRLLTQEEIIRNYGSGKATGRIA
ncbi:MAG: LamG domain-containing protein [Oscillospiraceae bacterium]|nr:LamG domain-containing protein [Oscillospiraceae bacterium]